MHVYESNTGSIAKVVSYSARITRRPRLMAVAGMMAVVGVGAAIMASVDGNQSPPSVEAQLIFAERDRPARQREEARQYREITSAEMHVPTVVVVPVDADPASLNQAASAASDSVEDFHHATAGTPSL